MVGESHDSGACRATCAEIVHANYMHRLEDKDKVCRKFLQQSSYLLEIPLVVAQ